MSHPLPEIRELNDDVSSSPYYNPDMAPTPPSERRWRAFNLVVLWVSLAACVTTYDLASGLIKQGMGWAYALLAVFLGNCIVLIPMSLNAHAGTRYGIPFPVYCRAAFGIRGANVPAMMRALVACCWFGIQTWIGGDALFRLIAEWMPADSSEMWVRAPEIANPSLAQLACFLAFWLVNVLVVWRGIHTIKLLLAIKAPLLIALGLALLAWAWVAAGGFGDMLARPTHIAEGKSFWSIFIPGLTANVGYWATLALNIPDFSRYARSQRDQVVGQAVGLPASMALYAFIGIAVTSATPIIYGQLIWDPIELVSRFENRLVLSFALVSICLATLATNIAANVVSPANDFANLAPRWISFKTGGVITGLIGIAIQPWHFLANADVYINTWLVGVSSFLGACGGVLIADYCVLRRRELDLAGLYRADGPYWYRNGWNPVALIAMAAGMAPCVPGFLQKIGVIEVSGFWRGMYDFAWFVSFGVAFGVYVILMRGTPRQPPHSQD